MRILIVEDDRDLGELLIVNLKQEGYEADLCQDGRDGLQLIRQGVHDLILLDRMLPYLDGLTILKTVRREEITTPVLMITALGESSQVIDGLDAGADDYIEKPFILKELLARIRAIQRRPRQIQKTDRISCRSLCLERNNRSLINENKQCSLSKRESDLLEILMKNEGKTLPRSLIFTYVWGVDAVVEDGNLDNYISYVRDRLREVEADCSIRTVRGVGYRLEWNHV